MGSVTVKYLGIESYAITLQRMQQFVAERDDQTNDEIWIVQHPPVYTQGSGCDAVTLRPSNIPVVKSDRGGQITYHGPGQIIMYVLLKLKRHGLGVKKLVQMLEQTSVNVLRSLGIEGELRAGAPGVYVGDKKISALGLRIKRGSSYHGLSLNVHMDLSPFTDIDPCGYQGLEVTQISDFCKEVNYEKIERQVAQQFMQLLALKTSV